MNQDGIGTPDRRVRASAGFRKSLFLLLVGVLCQAPNISNASIAALATNASAGAQTSAAATTAKIARTEATAELKTQLTDLRVAVRSIKWPLRDADLWRTLRETEKVAAILQGTELDLLDQANFTLHLARSFAGISRAETGGREAGESEPAAAARLRAAETFLSVTQMGSRAEDHVLRQRTWAEGELAQIYLEAQRPQEALHLARRAFRATTAQGDPLARYRFGTTLARALEATGDRAGALTAFRDASRLGETLRRDRLHRLSESRTKVGDPKSRPKDFEGQTEATQRLLALLLDDLAQSTDRLPAEEIQTQLREIRDLIETQRSAEIENYFGDTCLKEGNTAVTEAGPGALILYPILLEDRVVLLTSQNGTLRSVTAPITARALMDHARSLRRLLEKRTTRQYLRPAQHLYDALIRPLRDQLREDDVDVLVVIPDGLLRTIPFAALYNSGQQQFLIDEIAVALVPSMRLTEPAPLNRNNLSVLAAGLESATTGFARLEHTREEVHQVAAHFATSHLLFEEDFGTERLAQEIEARPHSIVHIATHGRVEADGLASFLVTRDGRIGLDRMAQLISTTRFRNERPLELLTLSACETASGDAEAALGLAGVAVRAGARSALATLWPVNDEATARMIDLFYTELVKPEQTRAGALRDAQRAIQQNPQYAHPGYWAPFLMISNWR